MSSGFKKGTQIYFPFLSKSPRKRIPSRFPNRAPTDRDTHLQGIFMYLLIYLFISPKERVSLHCLQKWGIYGNRHHSRALLNISFRVPSKGALPPSHGVPSERDAMFLEPSFIHHSTSLVYEPPPDSRFPSDVKGPLWREMPIFRAFL